MTEFAPPWTYTEIQAFLGLVGHYRQFIKGFACIVQPLQENLSGEGASKKNEQVTLVRNTLGAFKALKKASLGAPVLTFADFSKLFLFKTDASKQGLGPVLSQKQMGGWYHPVAYVSQSLTVHEHKYHSIKHKFLALKWSFAKQFQEYLFWKPFIVKLTTTHSLTSWLHPV